MAGNNELFSEFGLTGNEGKLFELLLSNSPITGATAATKLGINKSVAYFVLDHLVQKGFASYVVVNKRKEYRTIDPAMLNLKLEERKKEFLKKYGDINSILSQVTQKKKKGVVANLFTGWITLKTGFNELLAGGKPSDEWYVFSVNVPESIAPRFRRFMRSFHEQRVAKKLICNLLIDKKYKSTIGADRQSEPYTNVRFVSEKQSMPVTVNIYGTKTLLAIWTDEPLIIILESNDVAESFRSFFKLLWRTAKTK